MKGLTTFEIDTDETGILVSRKFNGKPVKQRYAVDMEQAEAIRMSFVNEFWGFNKQAKNTKVCLS